MDNIKYILTDILMLIYEKAGAALVFAFMAMCIKKYFSIYGKKIFNEWFYDFFHNRHFRLQFFFCVYCFIVLLQTIFCREIWNSPLSDVFGEWSAYNEDNSINVDVFENLFMLLPYTFLMFAAIPLSLTFKCIGKPKGIINILCKSFIYAFSTSLCIEFLQLFFKFGTFQLSDIVYNTVGGLAGGLLYWTVIKMQKNKKQ